MPGSDGTPHTDVSRGRGRGEASLGAAPVLSLLPRRVSTSNLEAAQRLFSRLYGEATLEPSPRGPFGYTCEITPCGPVTLIAISWSEGGRATVPVLQERFVLRFSVEGTVETDWAKEHAASVPGRTGALFSPGPGTVLRAEGASRGRAVAIDRRALEAHWRTLTGDEIRDPLVFRHTLDLRSEPASTIVAVSGALWGEASRPNASSLLVASLRDALFTGLLTNVEHSATHLLARPPRRIAPGQIRRAEDFIDAHASEPITLGDVAAAAGVSVRTLQAAFKQHRGVSPMERVRERRLHLARQALLAGALVTTIAGVVEALGLGDAGRFSVRYKERYGESPSTTLGRARG